MTDYSNSSAFFTRKSRWMALAASGLIALAITSQAGSQTLPANAAKTCLASTSAVPFSAWFTGGDPSTLNAAVTPADSVNFTNDTALANTDFYQWAYRMFLWLTSPSPSTYGGTGLVMSSPEFYNLSAPDASGAQTLTQNESRPVGPGVPLLPPRPLRLGLRVANLGPHNLPIIKDTQGRFFEVAPLKLAPSGKPLILNSEKKEIELLHVVPAGAGQLRFIGTDHKAIRSPQMLLHPRAERLMGVKALDLAKQPQPNVVFKLNSSLIHGVLRGPIFVLPGGRVIAAEPGDSDGNVQLTQAGSLIYYNESVNDVYAYFATQINPVVTKQSATFPTDADALASITAFAKAHGHTFPNPNALAIELKTAWVDASTLSNSNEYITMMAEVPTYDRTTNPTSWTQNGIATIKVALVGIHVVGSVNGHPEMVWSTFEHFGNTPNVAYAFNDTGNAVRTQPSDPVGGGAKWLFCGAATPPANFSAGAAASSSTTIVSNKPPVAIQGASALRLAPFGAPNNQKPNPLISSVAASNTQIISINNDVHSQMNAADVRNQYFFEGATWTEGGASPSTNFSSVNGSGNVVGTSHLANSTLETFTQSEVFVPGDFPGPGCLACHRNNTTDVSHIFSSIKALF